MKLIIEDDEGRKTVVPIVREEIEITIGRHEENTIRLTERNVSRRHAKLLRKVGSVWVEDLGSYNGVRVNGDRIQGRIEVKEGDLIQIGDYDLAVQLDGAGRSDTLPSHTAGPPSAGAHPPAVAKDTANGATSHAAPAQPPKRNAEPTAVIHVDQVQHVKRQVVDIPPEQAPRLVLISTPLAGREYACIRSELSLGRTDDNDIAIDHRSLSRNHAKVFRDEDGTWKIIDLQSANGVKVNGETYAHSPLKFGDTVELGHAKFKFVAPGEDAGSMTVSTTGRRSASKPPVKLVAILLGGAFAVGGAVAVVIARSKPATLPVPPAAMATSEPAPPAVVPSSPSPKTPPVVETKPPEPPIKPAEPPSSAARQAYELGLKLMGERKFDEAAKALQTAKEGGVADADEPLERAQEELPSQKALLEAQDKAAKKDWEGARASAEKVPEESALAADAHKIIEKAEKAETQKKPASPPPKAPVKTAKAEKGNGPQEAQKMIDQAADLLRRQQPKEAATFFERALVLDPTQTKVHKYLGSAYAQLGDNNKAALHYRKYIQAYPNAPDTPAIRENLKAYEDSLKGPSEGGE
jgi:ABC transport system ATP-binding/permease protein